MINKLINNQSLVSSLCKEMAPLGMKGSAKWNNAWSTLNYLYWLYIGFTTDGEFNYLQKLEAYQIIIIKFFVF